MTSLNRLVIAWAGGPVVGAAVTVLHFSASDNSAPPVGAVKAAFAAAASSFPAQVTWTFPNSGDVIDDTTGNLVGAWSTTGGGSVTGSLNGNTAAGVGACIGWTTGGIVTGAAGKPHRLRGRTFLVPLSVGEYDVSGALNSTSLTRLGTLANAIQASGPLAIWHRPTTKGGSDGNSYGVISNRIRPKVAYLSSRRD